MKKILAVVVVCLLAFCMGCSGELDDPIKSDEAGASVVQSNDTNETSQGSNITNNEGNNQNGSASNQMPTSQNSQGGQTSSANNSTSSPLNSSAQNQSNVQNSAGSGSEPQQYTLKNADFTGISINAGSTIFSAMGYANGVTGGGNLSESNANYVKVSTAKEFVKAIGRKNYDDKNDSGFSTRPMVVEITKDIDLGWNVIDSETQGYSDIVAANPAVYNPALKSSGVSLVYISGRQNLTIFSKNGATIKHACFQIRGYDNAPSKNLIIRNIRFEGAWEWDDGGSYDKNDWDVFTIRADKGEVSDVWIDHCTFTKPYDGTIDIKYGATNVTISWCSFIPHSTNDADFMSMMNYLEQNRSAFTNYNAARNAGATFEDMIAYAQINKKVHLIGHTDNNPGDDKIRATYCYNYYENCTERIPRLRLGKAHVYNCVIDATKANQLKNKFSSLSMPEAISFASNGSLGTNYGELLLENCHISGLNTPLRNNNKKAGAQYTGYCDALYSYYTAENIDRTCDYGDFTVNYMGRYTFLGHSTKNDGNLMSPFPINPLAFDTDAFKAQLGYEYTLYDCLQIKSILNGNVGAGALSLSSKWLSPTYQANENLTSTNLQGAVKGSTANLGASRK